MPLGMKLFVGMRPTPTRQAPLSVQGGPSGAGRVASTGQGAFRSHLSGASGPTGHLWGDFRPGQMPRQLLSPGFSVKNAADNVSMLQSLTQTVAHAPPAGRGWDSESPGKLHCERTDL